MFRIQPPAVLPARRHSEAHKRENGVMRMIRQIVRDTSFLSQRAEPAGLDDLETARDRWPPTGRSASAWRPT